MPVYVTAMGISKKYFNGIATKNNARVEKPSIIPNQINNFRYVLLIFNIDTIPIM